MDNTTRKTFVDKFFSFITSWFKNDNKYTYEDTSIFLKILDKIDKEDDLYIYASTAADLCDKAFSITEKKFNYTSRKKRLEKRMIELKSFHNLSEEKTEELLNMLERFININKEKSSLNNQLMSFDKSLGYLDSLKEDAKFVLEQMEESEKKQRILRYDIGQIEGEKADLEYIQGILVTLSKVFKFLSYVILFSFIVGTAVIGYFYVVEGSNILTSSLIIAVGVAVLMSMVFIGERKIRFEIRYNIKRQKRAVELLNKKNTINAYYTNYLRYEHKKYKVTNFQMLERNLKDLENYQYISKRYDAIRKITYEAENEIENFLKIHDINITEPSLINFSKQIRLQDRKESHKELEKELDGINFELGKMDTVYEKVWDNILSLDDDDEGKEKVINNLMEIYFDEVNKLYDDIKTENIPTQEELENRMKDKLDKEKNLSKVDKDSLIV